MAIVNFISCQRSQTVGGLNGVINYCCQKSKTGYEGRQLISGVNCVPQVALQEFMNTKRLHKNTDGRMYYHMIQSFHPGEPLTPEEVHEIALKLAEEIPGHEIVIATHTDRLHGSYNLIDSITIDSWYYVSYGIFWLLMLAYSIYCYIKKKNQMRKFTESLH